MDKRLEQEMQTIINRYQVHLKQKYYYSSFTPCTIDNFEIQMNWEWLWENFHPSHLLICEFHHKLDMDKIFDSLTMTRTEFKYYMDKREKESDPIHSRTDILDIR